MNVKEAFEILKAEGLTSSIQVVRRWIREGKIKATMKGGYHKGGYDIKEKDLEDFILSKLTPGRDEEEFTKNMIRLQEIEKKIQEITLTEVGNDTELVYTKEKHELLKEMRATVRELTKNMMERRDKRRK